MLILDSEIYQTLSLICPTYQGYIREWKNDLPCISFLCTNNSSARKLDGVEWSTYLNYKVDLFCDIDDDYINFSGKVDDAMGSMGFKRESMTLVREDNADLTHIMFYYSVYIDKDGFAWNSI